MSDTRRTTSTAARINRSFMLRLAYILFVVNLMVLALACFGWCYFQEKDALGAYWQWSLRRSVSIDAAAPWYRLPGTIRYTFFSPLADMGRTVDGGAYFMRISYLFIALLCMEALLLLAQYGAGKQRAQKLLTPLRRMAETAQTLDESLDAGKYQSLEAAIAHLDVGMEDARIETGDRDLQGLENAVNGLLRRAREAYRQQTRFVSDASHELRTPISVIRGYTDMLDRWGKHDEKVRDEAIAAIRKEADGMQRLVEQLLFLARGDSGRLTIGDTRIDLTALLGEVCDEMQLVDEGRQFLLQSDAPVYARGDFGMLKQAARILVENAMRYSPPGERVTLRAFVNDKGEGCFTVQDNGIGMRQEDVKHVFERFYRSDHARTRTGGTGLGLSIAKWIADAHGGYFRIVTREGVGTRVTLCLPPCAQTEDER